MHENERAFREVKDGQYSANRCFVPGATPWQHLSFFGLFMRWVRHLLALADAGSTMRGEGCRSKRFLFQPSQSRGYCTICDSIHPKPELPFSLMLFPDGLLSCLRRQRLLMVPNLKDPLIGRFGARNFSTGNPRRALHYPRRREREDAKPTS